MPFNEAKCTILHIGQSNPKIAYFFEQTPIPTVTKQRDLGITITSDLKWETHITLITKKANSMIYLIQKSFKDLSKEMILKLHKSYVRPKLEYAQSIWSPYYIKDIEQIERVQRRITRLPQELKNLQYEERFSQLYLTTHQQLFRAVKRKRELWDHYQANRTEEKYQIFRPQNNKLKQQINEARRKYECEIAESSNKKFFSYVKRTLKSNVGSVID